MKAPHGHPRARLTATTTFLLTASASIAAGQENAAAQERRAAPDNGARPSNPDRTTADEPDADPLIAAWLHELLGSPASTALAAYRAVAESETVTPAYRVRAAARALPIAAASGDEQAGLWWARALSGSIPARDLRDPHALLQRLTATQNAVRAWAANVAPQNGSPGGEAGGERLAALVQRLSGEPWKTLDNLAARPIQPADSVERQLRAAEARGDAVEAARLRQELPRRDADALRPRMAQLRRWSADALELELAGQHDKAQRLFGVVARRRPGRGPLTLQRFESEMQEGVGPRRSPRQRQLLEQALSEARKRAAVGDTRGVSALVGPALALLLWPAD